MTIDNLFGIKPGARRVPWTRRVRGNENGASGAMSAAPSRAEKRLGKESKKLDAKPLPFVKLIDTKVRALRLLLPTPHAFPKH